MKIDANKIIGILVLAILGGVGWYLQALTGEVKAMRKIMFRVAVQQAVLAGDSYEDAMAIFEEP